jgi:general stress protein YciG
MIKGTNHQGQALVRHANDQKEEIMAQGNQSKDSSNKSSNPGNFKNDPQKASEAGRKGGESRGRRSR